MLQSLEWAWLCVGALAILDAARATHDSWRTKLFGVSIITFALVDKLTPSTPSGSLHHLKSLWMAAACLQAVGLALNIPTLANGRFAPDRDLANQFVLALLACLITMLPELSNPTPWNAWLPLPVSLWLLSVVLRWLRRLYRRNEKNGLACAAALWALTCVFSVASGWWQVKLSPVIAYFLLAALTAGSVAYITYGGPTHKPPGESAPA
jgi:hypothetical protein